MIDLPPEDDKNEILETKDQKEETNVPRGWRPSVDTVAAISGEGKAPEPQESPSSPEPVVKKAEVAPAVQSDSQPADQKLEQLVEGMPKSPFGRPSEWRYEIGSPHDDFNRYWALQKTERLAELGRQAKSADTLPEALVTTAAAAKEAQSGESELEKQSREWLELHHGPEPYTEPAYPEITNEDEQVSSTRE